MVPTGGNKALPLGFGFRVLTLLTRLGSVYYSAAIDTGLAVYGFSVVASDALGFGVVPQLNKGYIIFTGVGLATDKLHIDISNWSSGGVVATVVKTTLPGGCKAVRRVWRYCATAARRGRDYMPTATIYSRDHHR